MNRSFEPVPHLGRAAGLRRPLRTAFMVSHALPMEALDGWRTASPASELCACQVRAHYRSTAFDWPGFWQRKLSARVEVPLGVMGHRWMRFDTLLQKISSAPSALEYSLAGFPASVLPESVRPPDPRLCAIAGCTRTTIWGGCAGHFWGMHVDDCAVAIVGLSGRKRIIVAPPDTPLLPPSKGNPSLCAIYDVETIGLKDYRRLRTQLWEATIGPGDLLFLPHRWWHQVSYLETSFSVSYWPES